MESPGDTHPLSDSVTAPDPNKASKGCTFLVIALELRHRVYSFFDPRVAPHAGCNGLYLSCKQIKAELDGEASFTFFKAAQEADKSLHYSLSVGSHYPRTGLFRDLSQVMVMIPRWSLERQSYMEQADMVRKLSCLTSLHLTLLAISLYDWHVANDGRFYNIHTCWNEFLPIQCHYPGTTYVEISPLVSRCFCLVAPENCQRAHPDSPDCLYPQVDAKTPRVVGPPCNARSVVFMSGCLDTSQVPIIQAIIQARALANSVSNANGTTNNTPQTDNDPGRLAEDMRSAGWELSTGMTMGVLGEWHLHWKKIVEDEETS
ncbi:hypothetical protein K504DRAFT_505907 [Pleomassaria siparia CBS 279.74]|uniref:Uncharacterized protein n=1 Tax=Pleomassaria siparia CBS 279.74 TaxID=1314801 RepID=A0A6G1JY73_9PLEO|nr:hypothetical protein K504DRAFT_505907 [Pleomassaria siparia CBS 279.74]